MIPTDTAGRETTEDERASMTWWNEFSLPQRRWWLLQAGNARPVDAWRCWRAAHYAPRPADDGGHYYLSPRASPQGEARPAPRQVVLPPFAPQAPAPALVPSPEVRAAVDRFFGIEQGAEGD